MRLVPAVLALSLSLVPASVFAQDTGISGSPLPDQPYTLIYPGVMVTSGEPGGPLTIDWRESDSHVLMTGPWSLDGVGTLPEALAA